MAPVLFIIFNRPDTTARVFEAIRRAQPPRLYVAADGPRPDRPGEAERCLEARRLATQVDWPCEVHTLFQNDNLGCRDGPTTAIDWFFELEPEGIILEDDCLPDPSFFPYCAELLLRYRHERRVMMISGDNIHSHGMNDESYYFSQFTGTWGWATWRRAWELYDKKITTFSFTDSAKLLRVIRDYDSFVEYWRNEFQKIKAGESDTCWDYQWLWTCWRENGLSCAPGVNLVRNIGFGPEATHTTDASSNFADADYGAIAFPLRHPAVVEPDIVRDDREFRRYLGERRKSILARVVRKVVPLRLLRILRHHIAPV